MPQTDIEPIAGACRHMRGRYKLQTSHKSPFPEKRLMRLECEKAHDLAGLSEENLDKCLNQQVGCWMEDEAAAEQK